MITPAPRRTGRAVRGAALVACVLASCADFSDGARDASMDEIGESTEGLDEPTLVGDDIYFASEIAPTGSHTLTSGEIALIQLTDDEPYTFDLDVSDYAGSGKVCLSVGPAQGLVQYAVESMEVAHHDGNTTVELSDDDPCYSLKSGDTTLTLTLSRFQSAKASGSKYGRIVVGVRPDPYQNQQVDVVTNGCDYCDLTSRPTEYNAAKTVAMPWREMDLEGAHLGGVTLSPVGQGGGLDSSDFIFVGDFSGATFDHGSIERLPGDGYQLGDTSVPFMLASASDDSVPTTWGVPCSGATFYRTELNNDVSGLDLDGASLNGSNVEYAIYAGTEDYPKSLQNVDLGDAYLHDSTFSYTQWQGSHGVPWKVDGNVLNCASFSGTDFTKDASEIGLTLEQIYANVEAAWLTNLGLADCHVDLSEATLPLSDLPLEEGTTAYDDYKDIVFGRFIYNRATVLSGDTANDLAERPFADYTFASGISFDYAQVQRWSFAGATFPAQTSFNNADLTLTSFAGASLRKADFTSDGGTSVLDEASFDDADLTEADFSNLDLSGTSASTELGPVTFVGALLHNTDFSGATLDGVHFDSAIITHDGVASLLPDTLTNVSFRGANLAGQKLTNKNFQGTSSTRTNSFVNAVLINADFTGSSGLTETFFTGAYLQGTNFSGVDLSGANFKQAVVSTGTGSVTFTVNDSQASVSYGATNFYNAKLDDARCPSDTTNTCPVVVDAGEATATPTECDTSDPPTCRWTPQDDPPLELCCVARYDPATMTFVVCPKGYAVDVPCEDNCDCSSRFCVSSSDADGGASEVCASSD